MAALTAPMPAIERLLAIMARLRDPANGCPWDVAQTFATIAPYTIEEAYEVADAIDRNDLVALRDELGDLLLQVVFHARIAQEQGAFDFADVVAAISDKMVRRHPHVFADQALAPSPLLAGERAGALDVGFALAPSPPLAGERAGVRGAFDVGFARAAEQAGFPLAPTLSPDGEAVGGEEAVIGDAGAQTRAWDAHKRAERAAAGHADTSALAGIARGLPEWQRALKLQQRAARIGFDWPGPAPVMGKLHEEIDEVRIEFDAVAQAPDDPLARGRLEEEIGDLLFVCANLSRHARVDPGSALRLANRKFERRFRAMEALAAADGIELAALSLEAQDRYWDRVKTEETSASP